MCVILHKPAGIDIPQETLANCFKANPNGGGFMYASDGILHIIKGLMTLENFMAKYNEHKLVEKEVIIHFRLTSAGESIPEQTHPFWIFENKLAFVHNGHMMDYDTGGLRQSDTMEFNNEILRKLPQDWLNNEAIMELVDSYIDGSVMVFMDSTGKIEILGDTGCGITTIDGVWFSNNYWMSDEEYSESTLDEDNTSKKDFEHQIYKECDEEDIEISTQELRDINEDLEENKQ